MIFSTRKRFFISLILISFIIPFLLTGQLGTRVSGTGNDKKKLGKIISVNFAGAPLASVIKVLADKLGRNIVLAKGVKGLISISLRRLPARRILDIILKTNNLAMVNDGGVWVIVKSRTRYTHKFGVGKPITRVVAIANVSAAIVFQRLKRIYISGKAKTASKFTFFIGEEKIILDRALNSIILHGRKEKIRKIEKSIRVVDVKTADVRIDVKIVEITLEDSFKFGFDWSALGDVSFISKFPASIGDGYNNGSISFSKTFTGGSLKRFSISGVLQAISQKSDIKIVSSPTIVVANLQSARIHIGSSVPYTKVTTTKDGDKLSDYNYQKVGIKLDVMPRIYKNYINLKIKPEISSAKDVSEPGQAPIVDTTQAETIISLKNGETVIIGGLIQNRKSKLISKIPLLGSLPLIGKLFSSEEEVTTKKELAIFITPRIIRNDTSAIREKKKRK